MNSEENKQLVMHAYDLFKRGDVPGILGMCADDIEWTSKESEYVPFSGTFNGKSGVADWFTKFGQSVQPEIFGPHTFIAEGDKVVVIGHSRFKVLSTGKSYDDEWVHVNTLRDGKCVLFEAFHDTAAAEAAFMPTAGTTSRAENRAQH